MPSHLEAENVEAVEPEERAQAEATHEAGTSPIPAMTKHERSLLIRITRLKPRHQQGSIEAES